MKVKNTYSRKNQGKLAKSAKPVITINVVNNVNIINNYFTLVNCTHNSSTRGKASTSKSESSSDLFEKIKNGPVYNVRNQSSTFGSSGCGGKFLQRQDTVEFYKSDLEHSNSTDFSNNLFKCSKDSDDYTPSWHTPPEYCKVKNKLVKVKKEQKIAIFNKKQTNRVQKKRCVAKQKKAGTQTKSLPCTSSTPNRSNALLKTAMWPDAHVSPIMPLQPSSGHLYIRQEIHARDLVLVNKKSIHGVSALIEGLGNLDIHTPHRKKVGEIEEQERELFDYNSPMPVSSNCQSKELNRGGSLKPDTDLPYRELDGHSGALHQSQVKDTDNPKMLTDISDLKSNEEVSKNSIVSSPHPCKKFEDETSSNDTKNTSERSSLASHELEDKLSNNSHDLSNNCMNPENDSDYNSDTKADLEPGNPNTESPVLPLIPENVIIECKVMADVRNSSITSSQGNTLSPTLSLTPENKNMDCKKETELRNSSIGLSQENSCDSSPHIKLNLKPDNVKVENSESSNDNCCLNVSSLSLEGKCNSFESEETNRCKPSEEIEAKEFAGEISLISSEQESLLKEFKRNIKIEDTKLESNEKYKEARNLFGSNRKTTPVSVLKSCENILETSEGTVLRRNRSMQPSGAKEKFSQQPLATLNETFFTINLQAGKKWRRSLIRQKQSEAKFNRREPSLSVDSLKKIIKESSFLSNNTKISINASGIVDCLSEGQESRNNISSEFDVTLSKLTCKRPVYYVNDLNEIPEESFDFSDSKLNETEFIEKQISSEQLEDYDEVCANAVDEIVNQTKCYETPPLLKLNPEAMSAITDRKSRRYRARSWGECSLFYEESQEQIELSDEENEENNFFASCLSILDMDENQNDENIKAMGKAGLWIRCEQQGPLDFAEAFPERVLKTGRKLGEGVYGEVFMLERPGEQITVIKVIPLEGDEVVNGAVQKQYHEVLSELIVTEEVSNLRGNTSNYTSGFCELINKFHVRGEYPPHLLELWNEYHEKKGSENDCPDMFGPDQLFLVMELAHGGEPVESFRFNSPQQAVAVFLQTTFSLAVAESAVDFEHRDLHVGNILVKTTTDKYVSFVLNGTKFETPSYGTKATIIDCTLSRMSFKGDVIYFDLEKDPELFTSVGDDYQFDIYRHMRSDVNCNWRDHQPKTNVRWLHYLIDKLAHAKKYKQKKNVKLYRENMGMLLRLKEMILDFYSATDLAQHLIESFSQTVSLIKR